MTPFASAHAQLLSLGFTTIPILPPDTQHNGRGKAPGEYVSGGWRGMMKWQRFRDQRPSAFELGLWQRFSGANIGVVMGTAVRDDLHVGAVDFDATDPDVLDALLRAAPASPMVKCGQKGETRFYLMPKEIKSKPYDGPAGRLVDVLTGFDCRQTVVPPSVHPSGATYAWTAGPVAATDLPVFGRDELDVLEEALEAAGWSREGKKGQELQKRVFTPSDSDTYWDEIKTAALANLQAWVPALGLHDCRRARQGYEAVATWRASSTGQPIENRKRNLSIQPNGIKDFGTNDTYSAIDLVMAARDCDQADATEWLKGQLAGPDESGVVIALRPREVVVDAPKPINPPRPDASQCINSEIPAHLLTCPGLVGDLTQWITDTARRPQPILSLGAALTIVGTAAGRKFGGPTRSGTHLYVLALAPTSAGKDHALQQIKRILTAATLARHIGPPSFMSMSALVTAIAREPLMLSPMDEFGAFLKRINNRRSPHEQAITGVLRTAWGSSFETMSTPEWAGRSSQTIQAPALSLYGASVPDEFYEALEGGDVFNGFLNRFLALPTRFKPLDRDPPADKFAVPETLSAAVLKVYNALGPMGAATMHNGMAEGPMIVADWADAQARRAHELFRDRAEAMSEDIRARAFYGRTYEMGIRLATIRAIGINPERPAVTVEDMDWGAELAMWSAARLMEDAGDYMAETQVQSDANRVVRLIKERGKIQHRDLLRALGNRMRSRDLGDLLKQLADAELISVEKITPPSGGHAVSWYSVAA